jgi:hypothetical protein
MQDAVNVALQDLEGQFVRQVLQVNADPRARAR